MSNIFNQLVKQRIQEFNNCKPDGSGKWDVKPGQVVIQELHPTPIGVSGETMFCDANWRPNCYAPFYEGQTFKMNTDVLYNRSSFSTKKEVPQQDLLGQMVDISEAAIRYQLDRKGKMISRYNVKWAIICKDPNTDTVTPKTAGIYALVNTGKSKVKTLGEAMENFYEQCGEELREEAYYEGYLADEIYDLEY